MPQIDLLLAAELVVVVLLIATIDRPSSPMMAAEPPMELPASPGQWSADTDRHAQRILRLESRRSVDPAALG